MNQYKNKLKKIVMQSLNAGNRHYLNRNKSVKDTYPQSQLMLIDDVSKSESISHR